MGVPETIVLIAVLVLAAMALIVAEICTPVFGMLAVLALGCAAAAVYLCYGLDGVLGIVATIVAIIGLPIYSVAAVKVIPKTPLGRRLALRRELARPGEGTPEASDLSRFVGRKTTAETILRPSGTVRIDGRRIVAQAESGVIEKGQAVRVIRAAGTHVVVRKAES
jgi:membrane-bound ClpP family serine protease